MAEKDIYWQMYADSWAFHKKYASCVCDSDQFWEQVASDAQKISAKYDCRFIVELLLAEMDELERILKGKGGVKNGRI